MGREQRGYSSGSTDLSRLLREQRRATRELKRAQERQQKRQALNSTLKYLVKLAVVVGVVNYALHTNALEGEDATQVMEAGKHVMMWLILIGLSAFVVDTTTEGEPLTKGKVFRTFLGAATAAYAQEVYAASMQVAETVKPAVEFAIFFSERADGGMLAPVNQAYQDIKSLNLTPERPAAVNINIGMREILTGAAVIGAGAAVASGRKLYSQLADQLGPLLQDLGQLVQERTPKLALAERMRVSGNENLGENRLKWPRRGRQEAVHLYDGTYSPEDRDALYDFLDQERQRVQNWYANSGHIDSSLSTYSTASYRGMLRSLRNSFTQEQQQDLQSFLMKEHAIDLADFLKPDLTLSYGLPRFGTRESEEEVLQLLANDGVVAEYIRACHLATNQPIQDIVKKLQRFR